MKTTETLFSHSNTDIADYDLSKLTRFISEEFFEYFDEYLPTIETLLCASIKIESGKLKELPLLHSHFKIFRQELYLHLRTIKFLIFPLIENNFSAGYSIPKNINMETIIKKLASEHKKMNKQLKAIDTITNSFNCPSNGANTINNVYTLLYQLQHFYKLYSFTELNYLFPKLLLPENKINI